MKLVSKLTMAAAALGLAASVSACSTAQVTTAATNITTLATATTNLNNQLVALNVTILNNIAAQAKAFAPFNCGIYNLGSAIVANPTVAAKVNTYLTNSFAAAGATVLQVAGTAACTAAGLPAQPAATSTPAATTPAPVVSTASPAS